MKIGINGSFLRKPHTGMGQVTLHYLRQLCSTEKENFAEDSYIIFLEEAVDDSLLGHIPDNIQIQVVKTLYKRDDLIRKTWWEVFSLPVQVKATRCDAFLSLYQCPTIIEKSTPTHIMLVHDLIPEIFADMYLNNARKKIYTTLSRRAIQQASDIITVSEHTKKDLIKMYRIDEDQISVTTPNTDPIFETPITGEAIEEVKSKFNIKGPYIYTGGGLELRKNVESTILAYKNILDEKLNPQDAQNLPEVPTLVISGKLMPELAPLITDVEKLVGDLGIENHVKILGFVDQKDLPALYAGAEMFVFPSTYEGFGLPVLEAMKVGTAVITSNISSLPEVGDDAVLYCETSPESVQEKMTQLLLDKTTRDLYGEKGYERAKRFTWDHFETKIRSKLKESI